MNNLKDIVKQLEEILMANPLYNSFNYGSVYDVEKMSVKYPSIFMNTQVNSMQINDKTTDYVFLIVWYQKLKPDNEDFLQIQSDTLESCKDFIKKLKKNQDELELFIEDNSWPAQPFKEQWNDNVAGCSCTIKITKTGSGSSCNNLNNL